MVDSQIHALVIGGSSGLGLSIAQTLHAHGATTVVASRRGSCEGLPAYAVDVADIDSLNGLMDRVVAEYGALHILVNSAGTHFRKPSLDVTPEEWDALMAVNVGGTFFACQAAARHMIRQGKGCIINVSSINGAVAFPQTTAYCTSKAAVTMITKALASEWATLGIRVNEIAPGVIPTPLNAAALADESRRRRIEERTPLQRLGTPAEVATAVLYLAADASSYTTGSTLYIDGGLLASGL